MKKIDEDWRTSLTFPARIIVYQNAEHHWDVTINDAKQMIENDCATIEFIMSLDLTPILIIRPKMEESE